MYPLAVPSRVVLLVMFVVFGWMLEVTRASEILERGFRLKSGRFGRRMLKIAGALRMALKRRKRDENESVKSAFGRGVGFYIGEPCDSVCNNILFEVYCNKTSGRCECHDHYPVNIENRLCIKAARLGDSCKHDHACAFFDDNAVCPSGTCRCADGFQPSHHIKGTAICLPASSVTFLENSYLMTSVSAVAGLVIITALLCLVLRLFSKARFDRPSDRMASAGSPPTMLSAFTGSHVLESRRPSRSSGASTDYLPASRRASYSMLAPPSSLGSRRPSTSSMRSGLSFRTQSSFRGYRYYSRDPARRTLSSPAESSPQYAPPSPCKVPHHNHPLHHNSPVDDEDIMDVRFSRAHCKCEPLKQSHIGNSDNLDNFLIDEDDDGSSCREYCPIRDNIYSKPASNTTRQSCSCITGETSRTEEKHLYKGGKTFEQRKEKFKRSQYSEPVIHK